MYHRWCQYRLFFPSNETKHASQRYSVPQVGTRMWVNKIVGMVNACMSMCIFRYVLYVCVKQLLCVHVRRGESIYEGECV